MVSYHDLTVLRKLLNLDGSWWSGILSQFVIDSELVGIAALVLK